MARVVRNKSAKQFIKVVDGGPKPISRFTPERSKIEEVKQTVTEKVKK